MSSIKKYFYPVFIFSVLSCHSNNEEETLYPEKNFITQFQFPYKPQKINIVYYKDSILLYKIFNSKQKIKHTLFLKNNQFYFFDKFEKSYQGYPISSYLFLKNEGIDSCYSVVRPTNKRIYFNNLQGFDLCFSKLKDNNFTTIIRFNTKDSTSYSENYFYTQNYRIYKIALRYKGILYWYKMKK